MSFFKSNWDLENLDDQAYSNQPTSSVDTKTDVSKTKLELIGMSGVLLIIVAIVVSLTVIITGNKTSTTTSSSGSRSEVISTTATVTPDPYTCSNMTSIMNRDLVGNDIAPFPVLNYTACCSYCITTSGCAAFTWGVISQMCYRKTSIGSGGNYNVNYVSAKY